LSARTNPPSARISRKRASRDAERLERERPPYAVSLAKTIRAAIAYQRGDTGTAQKLLASAGEELTNLGWGCFGVPARRQHGRLLEGSTGGRIVGEVDTYLRQQGVKQPDRLCAVQIPGFQPR
jgi:hypothetical protein